jgi:hypothetical protein
MEIVANVVIGTNVFSLFLRILSTSSFGSFTFSHVLLCVAMWQYYCFLIQTTKYFLNFFSGGRFLKQKSPTQECAGLKKKYPLKC